MPPIRGAARWAASWIAARRSLRELRVATEEVATRSVPDPAEAVVAAGRRAGLLEAVDALPDALREVVTCRYLLELSEAETPRRSGSRPGPSSRDCTGRSRRCGR